MAKAKAQRPYTLTTVPVDTERLAAIKAEAVRRYLPWTRMIAVLAYERLEQLAEENAGKDGDAA